MPFRKMMDDSQAIAGMLTGHLASYPQNDNWIPTSQAADMSPIGSAAEPSTGRNWMNSLMSFMGNKDGNMQGMGMNYLGAGMKGIGALGSYMQNKKAMNLAKDQFKFAKDFASTNLNNQIQSYNTALEDRARTRAIMENRDEASARAYYDKHKLSR